MNFPNETIETSWRERWSFTQVKWRKELLFIKVQLLFNKKHGGNKIIEPFDLERWLSVFFRFVFLIFCRTHKAKHKTTKKNCEIKFRAFQLDLFIESFWKTLRSNFFVESMIEIPLLKTQIIHLKMKIISKVQQTKLHWARDQRFKLNKWKSETIFFLIESRLNPTKKLIPKCCFLCQKMYFFESLSSCSFPLLWKCKKRLDI